MNDLPRRQAVSIAIGQGQGQGAEAHGIVGVSVSVSVPGLDAEPPVLIVQRPPDDADLPDAWGLPAASLRAGDDWEAAARRAAREKLGVDVDIGPELNRGAIQRAGNVLEMRLFQAKITGGAPAVPQPFPDVTQYQSWRWGTAADLRPAADRGSLCCRLYLGVQRGVARSAPSR